MNNNVASLAMNLNVFRLSEKSYWPAGEFITFDWMAWPEQIQAARYTSSKQRQISNRSRNEMESRLFPFND